MPSKKFDVAVIGAGPGGYVAAIRCGQLGKKTLLIERDELGGICLNHGCIPSKALITAGHLFERIGGASEMGIMAERVRADMKKVQAWKEGVVSKLTGGVEKLCKANEVTVLKGSAAFLTARSLEVKTAKGALEKVEFQNAVVATGSRSVELRELPFDHERVLSSRSGLRLKEIPEHLVVVGGGYIGLELGMAYQSFGAKLTVIELTEQLLPGTDPDLVRVVERALRKRGADVHLKTVVKSAEKSKTGVSLVTETEGKPREMKASHVLVSVGRRPCTEGLSLEKAGLSVDESGFLPVNERCQTKIFHIHAIGDVSSPPLLAHKASYEGEVAAEAIAGHAASVDYKAMPWAVFTTPEVAGVGLSEAEARDKGHEIFVGKFPLAASGRVLTMGEPADGFVKIIADKNSHQVLGVGMVGPEVSNLISEGTLALEMGAVLEDIALTVHVHPTLCEPLMEAAKHALGRAIHTLNR